MLRTVVVVAFLEGCSCNGGDGGDKDSGGATGSDQISDVACTNGTIPGVVKATWTTDLTGTATVQYGKEDFAVSTPDVDAAGGAATVLGLQGAQTYQFKVVIGDQESSSVECQITPPPQG